ncbi:flagellar biosynthetic protein FliO [Enterobacter cloacae subsp. cloacae]|uniref:flagellar biosynthetic protein FliO n=1 Tax=Enterobacter TaxID=547 RepID=UPI0007B3D06A|nr:MULTISPECIES: flagellar biosynthetic protein FliO [Enterobacter cloacae complex]ELE9704426.1 flagellar biosynthetic protein FliO [Enterobacter cloacae]ELK7332576.1 flagellar biosynthetic protein FliO [Enterobacter cloacae]KZP63097.1 flagellar biosynthesis protein FliO [Enterobacter cloacae subsp. dissolvens]MBW4201691.1 flagellar biosynthetic protein FliO [Enterobacter cloacae subsp. cloacae]MCR6730579.1 flagellar biosynthetic protein FliO [Enterobacter cloacae]
MNATDSLPATGSVLMTVSGALALIILLMVVMAWAARRSGLARRLNDAQGNMTLVATQSLGPRERLVLVDVGEQRLVLGVTASQITCLATQPRPENAPQTTAPAATFPLMLEKLRQKYRPGGEQ